MKPTSPNRPNPMLWWTAIISLAVSTTLFFFLKSQAELDVRIEQQRMIFPVIGLVIAGVCLITGTAGYWFRPK